MYHPNPEAMSAIGSNGLLQVPVTYLFYGWVREVVVKSKLLCPWSKSYSGVTKRRAECMSGQ